MEVIRSSSGSATVWASRLGWALWPDCTYNPDQWLLMCAMGCSQEGLERAWRKSQLRVSWGPWRAFVLIEDKAVWGILPTYLTSGYSVCLLLLKEPNCFSEYSTCLGVDILFPTVGNWAAFTSLFVLVSQFVKCHFLIKM